MDSFADFSGGNDAIDTAFTKRALPLSEEKVHLRVHLRNRKKCVTTVEGLADDLDLRALKKQFKCNGSVVKDEIVGEIIQLQGDTRMGVAKFLVSEEILGKDSIVLHGF